MGFSSDVSSSVVGTNKQFAILSHESEVKKNSFNVWTSSYYVYIKDGIGSLLNTYHINH